MELKELLAIIAKTAKVNRISDPFICGGIPRDKLIGAITSESYTDIDITTGDAGSHMLGEKVSMILGGDAFYKHFSDGHSRIVIDDLRVDFSSNWNAPGIDGVLKQMGISKPIPMMKEAYSRDFTCDTLLMPLNLKTIKDPIGKGVNDIKSKILRTTVPVEYALGGGHHKVVRVIYLAAKLGFEVDPEIKSWLKEHPMMISNASEKFVARKLHQACSFDTAKVVKLLDEMNLWKFIPLISELVPYLSQDPRRI